MGGLIARAFLALILTFATLLFGVGILILCAMLFLVAWEVLLGILSLLF